MHPRVVSITFALLFTSFFLGGCDSQPGGQTASASHAPSASERVRAEVATILKKDASQIDVARPLAAQGADELAIVEIVLALEQAFEVEIPDSAIGENGEAGKTLTIQKLAEIVSEQQKTR